METAERPNPAGLPVHRVEGLCSGSSRAARSWVRTERASLVRPWFDRARETRGRLQPAEPCPRLQPGEGGPSTLLLSRSRLQPAFFCERNPPGAPEKPAGSRLAHKREKKGCDEGSGHPHLKVGALVGRLKPIPDVWPVIRRW